MRQEEALAIVRILGQCTIPQIVTYSKGGYVTQCNRADVYQCLRALERWGDVRRVGMTERVRGNRAIIWEVVE